MTTSPWYYQSWLIEVPMLNGINNVPFNPITALSSTNSINYIRISGEPPWWFNPHVWSPYCWSWSVSKPLFGRQAWPNCTGTSSLTWTDFSPSSLNFCRNQSAEIAWENPENLVTSIDTYCTHHPNRPNKWRLVVPIIRDRSVTRHIHSQMSLGLPSWWAQPRSRLSATSVPNNLMFNHHVPSWKDNFEWKPNCEQTGNLTVGLLGSISKDKPVFVLHCSSPYMWWLNRTCLRLVKTHVFMVKYSNFPFFRWHFTKIF